MKRIAALILAALLALCTFALAEEDKTLNLFTWYDYIDADTIAAFTERTGIAVNFQTFGSNEEMLLKMQAGGTAEYDLVLASDYVISAGAKQGLWQPLDRSALTNWENLNPDYLDQYFDPENVYSVPYTVGSPMIIYDPDRVEGEITSFADLWDEQFADSLWLIDDARVMIGEVLKSLGYSYNTTDPDQLAEAAAQLEKLVPNVRMLDYDMSYNYLTSGEARAAYLFTPFVVLSMMENPNLVAVYPSEGIGFGIDSLVIPADAPHPGNAHLFLNYLLEPEVAAAVAEYQCYINPNQAADALLSPDFAAMAPFHIPEELLATKEYVEDLGENESLFQDVWTNFQLIAG